MTNYETLLIDKKDGVATITLNRPAKKNAMNPKLHDEMAHALEALRYDEEARVLIITGAGDSFCAGMDLKEFFKELESNRAEYDRISRLAIEWRGRTLRYYPKPTIAMINGYCFGGGFSVVEGCDLAIAAEDATFGLSEINFKLFPGGAVSKTMANILRPRDALWYGLLGRPFDGKEAARIGFINVAVSRSELVSFTGQIAAELASKDPHALKATKDGYRMSLEMTWEASINFTLAKESELVLKQGNAFRTEGIQDFLKGDYRPGLESHGAKRATV